MENISTAPINQQIKKHRSFPLNSKKERRYLEKDGSKKEKMGFTTRPTILLFLKN